MCGSGNVPAEGADPPELVERSIPPALCLSVLASLRRHHTKYQMAVRNWCMMLKLATTTLLERLPDASARSKRAPTYRALTPKAVENAKIVFMGRVAVHTIERPVMSNTSDTLVTPTLAIILYMAHKGDPLYLWLIDQFHCGAIVKSGRKRKAPPSGSTNDGGPASDSDASRRRRNAQQPGAPVAGGGRQDGAGDRDRAAAAAGPTTTGADGRRRGLAPGEATSSTGRDAARDAEDAAGNPSSEVAAGATGAAGQSGGSGVASVSDAGHVNGTTRLGTGGEPNVLGEAAAMHAADAGGAPLPPAAALGDDDDGDSGGSLPAAHALSRSSTSAGSILATSIASKSTEERLLLGDGAGAAACGRCNPSVLSHCGVTIPPGMVAVSSLRVIEVRGGSHYLYGGDGTATAPTPSARGPSLLSVKHRPLIWDLSSIGYVRHMFCASATAPMLTGVWSGGG